MVGRKGKRDLIVTIGPPDELTFREKGRRVKFTVSLHHAYQLAIKFTVEQMYREKMETYNQKKKAGYRNLKRPKKPNLFLSAMYNLK